MPSPLILSSTKSFYWRLADRLGLDYFSFQKEGAGALLLIGIHLSDPRPWECARHRVLFDGPVGFIDLESKRILGKRFGMVQSVMGGLRSEHRPLATTEASWSTSPIDPIEVALHRISGTGDFLDREMMDVPSIPKSPGRIGPRPITATVEVRFAGDVLTLHGRNYSETSQCLHAELVLLLALSATLSRHPQSPSRLNLFHLRSQLKPCRMCAAFLHCVRDKCDDFRVVYDQDDPGPLARNTLLDRYGYRSRQTTSACDHSGALHT